MKNSEFPYEDYRNTKEWAIIEKAIKDLEENQDLTITTKLDYVIGYLTKEIREKKEK